MTEQELARIEALVACTTQLGDWVWNGEYAVWTKESEPPDGSERFIADVSPGMEQNWRPPRNERQANGAFIASAHQDVPALCKALREAWDMLDRVANDSDQYILGREQGLAVAARATAASLIDAGMDKQAEIIMQMLSRPLIPLEDLRLRCDRYEHALRRIASIGQENTENHIARTALGITMVRK